MKAFLTLIFVFALLACVCAVDYSGDYSANGGGCTNYLANKCEDSVIFDKEYFVYQTGNEVKLKPADTQKGYLEGTAPLNVTNGYFSPIPYPDFTCYGYFDNTDSKPELTLYCSNPNKCRCNKSYMWIGSSASMSSVSVIGLLTLTLFSLLFH